jgi:hypothetical protein
MLLSLPGLQHTVSWQQPEPLRMRLMAATRTCRKQMGHMLPASFWNALTFFQQEFATEACQAPGLGPINATVTLRACVHNRVRCAQLLIQTYNLLLRGKPLPVQQAGMQQQQQQQESFQQHDGDPEPPGHLRYGGRCVVAFTTRATAGISRNNWFCRCCCWQQQH